MDRHPFSFCIDFVYCSRNARYSIGQSSGNIGKYITAIIGVASLKGPVICCCDSILHFLFSLNFFCRVLGAIFLTRYDSGQFKIKSAILNTKTFLQCLHQIQVDKPAIHDIHLSFTLKHFWSIMTARSSLHLIKNIDVLGGKTLKQSTKD